MEVLVCERVWAWREIVGLWVVGCSLGMGRGRERWEVSDCILTIVGYNRSIDAIEIIFDNL